MVQDFPPWAEKILDRCIQMVKNDTVKKKVQLLLLEPFLQYFLELVFPYVIIVCVVFGLLIILMISILAVLILKLGHSVPNAVVGVGVS